MRTLELRIPQTPPSLNRFGSGDRRRYHREKRAWGELLAQHLMVAQTRTGTRHEHERATVEGSLRFPHRRRRDEGNFRFMLEKALGDALVARGLLADDTADRYQFGRLYLEAETGPARTLITVELEP